MISLNDLVSPLNSLIVALLRSPLHFVASKGLMVVHWSGRKSGTDFSIPVGYQKSGDVVTVLLSKPAEKNWWKNFRSPWPAELLIERRSRSAMGTWIEPGSDAFFAPIDSTLRRLPWMASQFGGFAFDPSIGLSEPQKKIVCEKVGVLRFELID
jgi:hypothetical protein